MQPAEYYAGRCPVGGELICPGVMIAYPDGATPYLICPLHGCPVPMGVIPKEEHTNIWAAFAGARAN